MADQNLSYIAGSMELPKLAPDLTYPTDKGEAGVGATNETVAVTAGVLSTVISKTGKYSFSTLAYSGLVGEAMTHKLTIDGEVIWNDVGQSGTVETLLGVDNNHGLAFKCDTSFLLEINTLTDTSVNIQHDLRPIL